MSTKRDKEMIEMTKTYEIKTPQTFERRVRQYWADWFRHATIRESITDILCECEEYGVIREQAEKWHEQYYDEMKEFYADTKTVQALMNCNH